MGEVVSYTKEGIEALINSAVANASTVSETMGVVVHGTDPNVARPADYPIVYWVGSAEPVNALVNDFRVDPDASPATVSFATQADIDASIAALVDAAPGTLDTLNELAAALGDDANFATTITNQLAAKQDAATAATDEELSAVKLGAMGVVIHGADANVARPAGYGAIHWIGTVDPVNASENDLWTNA